MTCQAVASRVKMVLWTAARLEASSKGVLLLSLLFFLDHPVFLVSTLGFALPPPLQTCHVGAAMLQGPKQLKLCGTQQALKLQCRGQKYGVPADIKSSGKPRGRFRRAFFCCVFPFFVCSLCQKHGFEARKAALSIRCSLSARFVGQGFPQVCQLLGRCHGTQKKKEKGRKRKGNNGPGRS